MFNCAHRVAMRIHIKVCTAECVCTVGIVHAHALGLHAQSDFKVHAHYALCLVHYLSDSIPSVHKEDNSHRQIVMCSTQSVQRYIVHHQSEPKGHGAQHSSVLL